MEKSPFEILLITPELVRIFKDNPRELRRIANANYKSLIFYYHSDRNPRTNGMDKELNTAIAQINDDFLFRSIIDDFLEKQEKNEQEEKKTKDKTIFLKQQELKRTNRYLQEELTELQSKLYQIAEEQKHNHEIKKLLGSWIIANVLDDTPYCSYVSSYFNSFILIQPMKEKEGLEFYFLDEKAGIYKIPGKYSDQSAKELANRIALESISEECKKEVSNWEIRLEEIKNRAVGSKMLLKKFEEKTPKNFENLSMIYENLKTEIESKTKYDIFERKFILKGAERAYGSCQLIKNLTNMWQARLISSVENFETEIKRIKEKIKKIKLKKHFKTTLDVSDLIDINNKIGCFLGTSKSKTNIQRESIGKVISQIIFSKILPTLSEDNWLYVHQKAHEEGLPKTKKDMVLSVDCLGKIKKIILFEKLLKESSNKTE